jgi:hypothetical protein
LGVSALEDEEEDEEEDEGADKDASAAAAAADSLASETESETEEETEEDGAATCRCVRPRAHGLAPSNSACRLKQSSRRL